MGTQKHCLTLELSKLFLDKCVNLQTDQRCEFKDTLYDIVSIKNNLDSIVIDIQDENVIFLSGEITDQNCVRLSFKHEALIEMKTEKENCSTGVSFSNPDGSDTDNYDESFLEEESPKRKLTYIKKINDDIIDNKTSIETNAADKFVYEDKNAVTLDEVNAHLRSLNIPTNPPNCIHNIRAWVESDRGIRMKITVRSGKTFSKYFQLPYKIVDFVDGDDFFPWLKSKSHVFIQPVDEKKLQSQEKLSEDSSDTDNYEESILEEESPKRKRTYNKKIHDDIHDSNTSIETNAADKFVYEDKSAMTLDQVNAHLRTLNIPTNPPNLFHDIRAYVESDRGIRMKIGLMSGKSFSKYFHRPSKIVDFVDGESFFLWLKSKSQVFVQAVDENKLQSQGKLSEETNAADKFVYEDINAVTLDQVNAHLRTINIPTNPPNLIHDIRAWVESGRAIRMKISVMSGKTISKYFQMPYEIVDFVDGDAFLPWLKSKSHVFIKFVDEKTLQSQGKLSEESNAGGKFVYEDKNTVTFDQVNSHLHTLNIITNPANIIQDISAWRNSGQGIRIRVSVMSGKNISKYFEKPYEIVDFVDGDNFFPWLQSKSHAFICFVDEKKLQSPGKLCEDIKKEVTTDSNEDEEKKDISYSRQKICSGRSNRKRKTCTSSSTNVKKKKRLVAKTDKRESWKINVHNQLCLVACPYCEGNHCMLMGMIQHMKRKHRDESDLEHQITEIEKKADEFCMLFRNDSEYFHCKYCLCLVKHSDIKQHLLDEHFDCFDINDTVRKISSILERESQKCLEADEESKFYILHMNKTARCKFCNILVPGNKLKKHMHQCSENEEKDQIKQVKEQCSRCLRNVFQDAMVEHKAFCEVDNASCPLCRKEFNNRSSMLYHKKWVHSTNQTVYPCKFCGKTFRYITRLARHLHSHSDDRPFVCDYCAETYRDKRALKIHIDRVHFNKYRYQCSECGHGMNKAEQLKKHVCGRTRNRSKSSKKPANPNVVPSGQLKTVTSEIESVLELAIKTKNRRRAITKSLGVPLLKSPEIITTTKSAVPPTSEMVPPLCDIAEQSPSKTAAPFVVESTPSHITTPSVWAPSSMATSSAWIPPFNMPVPPASPWVNPNSLGADSSSAMTTSSLGRQGEAAAYALGSSSMQDKESLPTVSPLESYANSISNHHHRREYT